MAIDTSWQKRHFIVRNAVFCVDLQFIICLYNLSRVWYLNSSGMPLWRLTFAAYLLLFLLDFAIYMLSQKFSKQAIEFNHVVSIF